MKNNNKIDIILWNLGIISFNIICFSNRFIGLDINSPDTTIKGITQTIIFFSSVILIYVNREIIYEVVQSRKNNIGNINHLKNSKNSKSVKKTIEIKDRTNNSRHIEVSRLNDNKYTENNTNDIRINVVKEYNDRNKEFNSYKEDNIRDKESNNYIEGNMLDNKNHQDKRNYDNKESDTKESDTKVRPSSTEDRTIDIYTKDNVKSKEYNNTKKIDATKCVKNTSDYKSYNEANQSLLINKLILDKDKKIYIKRLRSNKNKTTFSDNIKYTLGQIDRLYKKIEVIDEIISIRFNKGDISYNKLNDSIKDIENIFYFNVIQIIHKVEAFDEKEYLYQFNDEASYHNNLKTQKNNIYQSYKQAVEDSISDNEEILIKLDELVLEFSGLIGRESTNKGKSTGSAVKKVDELIQISRYYK